MHFISGLPRSGSTLLSALLKQNPCFNASMTSGLGSLISANLQIMSANSEVSLLMDEKLRPKILRSLFDAYYEDETADIVFDTNRLWTSKLSLLDKLYPTSKVIACVRDVPWIMDSFERVFRKNPFENTRLFSDEISRMTVYSRIESIAQKTSLVGYAWSSLKEGFYSEEADKLLVVDYEYLTKSPEKVLRLIYQFIEEPWFEGHDFENVEFDAEDFDQALGVSGLHKVKPKVEFIPRNTILPPDLFEKFKDMNFWKDVKGSKAFVITHQDNDNEQSRNLSQIGNR
jgi:sulfotransferase